MSAPAVRKDTSQELFAFATQLQTLAEQEKAQLAHTLHDELGGLLTAAKMDVSWLQSRLNTSPARERLTQLAGVLDEAMDLKRRIVDTLRPSLLDHFGLCTALRAHVEATCARAKLNCQVIFAENIEPVPKEAALALFRIAEEGLSNIVRHANAQNVRVELQREPQYYRLQLSDDGRGMDTDDAALRASYGLTAMRHRVEALGGRFAIDSAAGRGTTLSVQLPISSADPPRSP